MKPFLRHSYFILSLILAIGSANTAYSETSTLDVCSVAALMRPKNSTSRAPIEYIRSQLEQGCFLRYEKKDFSTATVTQLNQVILKGVQAWRTQDFDRRACVQCHGPDMIDLAYFNFDDKDVMRRSSLHVKPDVTRQIMDAAYAMRAKYKITPKDPMQYRPFQPGGEVLGDENGSRQSRDFAFGRYLAERENLLLLNTRISYDPAREQESIARAKDAARQISEINLAQLPVGIPLSRWSEDAFHGVEHNTFDDWLPEVEQIFGNHATVGMYQFQNRYLGYRQTVATDPRSIVPSTDTQAGPTDANFGQMIYWSRSLDTTRVEPTAVAQGGGEIEAQKFQSVLLATHFMRMEVLKNSGSPEYQPGRMVPIVDIKTVRYPFANAIWNLANTLHNATAQGLVGNMRGIRPLSMRTMNTFFNLVPNTIDPEIFQSYSSMNSTQLTRVLNEAQKVIPAWFWLGWIIDPTSKFIINSDIIPAMGEYFTLHLLSDFRNEGYPLHASFMIAKKNIEMLNAPSASVVGQNIVRNFWESDYNNTNVHRARYWPYFNDNTYIVGIGTPRPDTGTSYNQAMQGQETRRPDERILSGAFPETTMFNELKAFGKADYHVAGGYGFNATAGANDNARIQDPNHLRLYQQFNGNMYRMFLLLMLEAAQKGIRPGYLPALSDKINKAEDFFMKATYDGSYATSDSKRLIDRLRQLLRVSSTLYILPNVR